MASNEVRDRGRPEGDDYLEVNRTNWDARAAVHADAYGFERFLADPQHLSGVVRFDLPRLGEVTGLDVVHLQCHLGTDTLSLARLGARVTGVDLSGASLEAARGLAGRAGAEIDYVQSDVYSAPEALGGRRFDLVDTGIGAVTAVLGAGLELTSLTEHDSVPWDALPGAMIADDAGEFRLRERPERLPATFTLTAVRRA